MSDCCACGGSGAAPDERTGGFTTCPNCGGHGSLPWPAKPDANDPRYRDMDESEFMELVMAHKHKVAL